MSSGLKVTYLFHSGYLVKVSETLLIFDFYSDPQNRDQREKNINRVQSAILDPDILRVFVFASHNHRDHFDRDILNFDRFGKPVRYVFSSDINAGADKEHLHVMSPDQSANIEDLTVQTYGSTDQGVSFLISLKSFTLFHAGDLNWWHWFDESTEEELEMYEHDFKAIIRTIGQPAIDIAFFPVDPRLKAFDYYGGAYFIEVLRPRYFFPMHFGYDYQTTERFKQQIANLGLSAQVFVIQEEGQTFTLND